MSPHRKTPSLFAVLNRGRAAALCGVAATAIAVPTIAFAATSGSPAPAGVHAAALQSSAKPAASATKPVSATPSATASASKSETTKAPAPATKASAAAPKPSTKTTSETTAKQSTSDSSSNSGSSDSSSSGSSNSGSSNSGSSNSSTSVNSSNYADDLDGWINEAIAVMNADGVSAPSYNAIYQTAMNESSGNPSAENGWDSNAASGTPSIGLMQMVQSTFDAYAVSGHGDIWNPVDNIIAAAQYANATYGGLDSVVSARCGGSCWYGY